MINIVTTNWASNTTGAFWKKAAEKNIAKVKAEKKKKAEKTGKKLMMVKVCDHPLTYKEVWK